MTFEVDKSYKEWRLLHEANFGYAKNQKSKVKSWDVGFILGYINGWA